MDGLRHLHRQLAGRSQHEGYRQPTSFADGDPQQQRQRERRRLAGTRRCLPEQVASLEQRRDRRALHRRGFLVAQRHRGPYEAVVQAEVGEPGVGSSHAATRSAAATRPAPRGGAEQVAGDLAAGGGCGRPGEAAEQAGAEHAGDRAADTGSRRLRATQTLTGTRLDAPKRGNSRSMPTPIRHIQTEQPSPAQMRHHGCSTSGSATNSSKPSPRWLTRNTYPSRQWPVRGCSTASTKNDTHPDRLGLKPALAMAVVDTEVSAFSGVSRWLLDNLMGDHPVRFRIALEANGFDLLQIHESGIREGLPSDTAPAASDR